jgi:hypothetical protein
MNKKYGCGMAVNTFDKKKTVNFNPLELIPNFRERNAGLREFIPRNGKDFKERSFYTPVIKGAFYQRP